MKRDSSMSASGTEPDFTPLPIGTPYDGSTIAEETDWDGSDTDMPIQYELADGRRVWIPLTDYAKYRPAAPVLSWEERVERAAEAICHQRHDNDLSDVETDYRINIQLEARAALRAAFPEYAPKD